MLKLFQILPLIISLALCNDSQGQLGSGVIFRGDTALRSDDKSLYTGEYVDFAADPRIRGAYKNGLKEGKFEYYNALAYAGRKRSIDSIVNYSTGKRHGLKETYYQNLAPAVKKSAEYFKNDLLDGECWYWHSSGQMEMTMMYAKGKKLKETRYPVDKQIRKIEFLIRSFSNDTVYLSRLRKGDTVKIQIVAFKMDGELVPLTNFTIKSFLFAVPDFEMPGNAEFLTDLMVNRIFSKGYYSSDRFYISRLMVVDPNGEEYEMTDKTFYIR